MDFLKKYVNPFGYDAAGNQVDAYGVDHSNFSTRDEVEYQFERYEIEKQMAENLKQRGIESEYYPQLGITFWGNNPENNYGFGISNISDNLENRQSQYTNSALFPKLKANDDISYKLAQNNVSNVGTNIGINTLNKTDYSLYGDEFSKEFIDQMINNKEYQRALQEYAIPNEGGYVDNPKDPGGETNMGISKRYHPNEDIKNLTRERANALLFKEVWNWNGINTLPSEIRGFVFDHGIRTSPQNAIETTHKVLNIDPVGDIIGKMTLSRLKNMGYDDFLHRYQELVKKQDKQRSGYDVFGKGWDNRTDRYHISY